MSSEGTSKKREKPVPLPRSISFRSKISTNVDHQLIENKHRLIDSTEINHLKEEEKDDLKEYFLAESKEERWKKRRSQSMDDIFNSSKIENEPISIFPPPPPSYSKTMSDCVPSSGSGGSSSYGSSGGGRTSYSSTSSSPSPSASISLLERLIRTHPIWFLPSLQRSGALHLLQGREVGNFIVRSSTQPLTMAVSVKLEGKNVEHYLLHAVGNRIALENSEHHFKTVHQLIAHYATTTSCEIPVCLKVPLAISEATTRQQLRSLALLGQEFWSHSGLKREEELLRSPESESDNLSRNYIFTGFRDHTESINSSSNSLSHSIKLTRPTTLELSSNLISSHRGLHSLTSHLDSSPPPPPPRWSHSTLLLGAPLSLPSSAHSTPSDPLSVGSEGKLERSYTESRRKRRGLHYKDTQICELLFKGTKTSYDDKASDYEDIWSPHRLDPPLHLSTFKPVSNFKEISNCSEISSNSKEFSPSPPPLKNKLENRLSLNSDFILNSSNSNSPSTPTQKNLVNSQYLHNSSKNLFFSQKLQNSKNTNANLSKSKASLYSEPLDSLSIKRFANYRHSEPNIRWNSENSNHFENGTAKIRKNVPHFESLNKFNSSKLHSFKFMTLENIPGSPSHKMESEIEETPVENSENFEKNEKMSGKNSLKSKKSVKNDKNETFCVKIDCLGKSGKSKKCEESEKYVKIKENVGGEAEILDSSSKNCNFSKNLNVSRAEIFLKNEEDAADADESWKFLLDGNEVVNKLKFPLLSSAHEDVFNNNPNNNGQNGVVEKVRRFSRYDNLENNSENNAENDESEKNEEEISPPWDSSKWEHLLRIVSESTTQLDSITINNNGNSTTQRVSQMVEVSGNVERANRALGGVVRELALIENGFFGRTIKSFIHCTIDSKIQDPFKVMKNVRQFMSGMKNYLVGLSSDESRALKEEIKKQSSLLSEIEFLNIDAVLEEVLVDLILLPLNHHIINLLQNHHNYSNNFQNYTNSSSTNSLNKNNSPNGTQHKNSSTNNSPNNTQNKNSCINANENGLNLITNEANNEEESRAKGVIAQFQQEVSPIRKLDKWNELVCIVQEMDNYSSDSFLPTLSQVLLNNSITPLNSITSPNLVNSSINCGIECDAEYMVHLLPPSLLNENHYSLSLLQSAVSSIRNRTLDRKPSLSSIRVIVPDERNGTLLRKMVPIRETTTMKDVAKIVGNKASISNPSDYVLVRISNGEEKICSDGELVSSFINEGSSSALAYKRIDAKIGWPSNIS